NSTTNVVKQKFVPVAIGLDQNGIFNLFYDGKQIFTNVPLPSYHAIANSAYCFGARTGGANEDAWVDNLCINSFNIVPLHFLTEPVDANGKETLSATFS